MDLERDQAEQLQMIIFDDGEELKSVPTHVSKEVSNKQKRMNSLGSLALIIEEDAQQLEQINLESDRKNEKPLHRTGKLQPPRKEAEAESHNNQQELKPKQPESKQELVEKKQKGIKK